MSIDVKELHQKVIPSRLIVLLVLLFSWILWGSTFLGIKVAIKTIPPLLMGGVRFLIAGIILLLYLYVRKYKRVVLPSRKQLLAAIITGLILLLGGQGNVVLGSQYLSSGMTAILWSTVPLWLLLIEFILFKKKPSVLSVIGLSTGFLGLLFLVMPSLQNGKIDLNGMLFIVAGALCWAIGSVYSRSVNIHNDAVMFIALQMFFGGIFLVIASGINGDFSRFDYSQVSISSSLAMLYLIICGSLIGYSIFGWLITSVSATAANTYSYVSPVISIFLGWLILQEEMSLRIVLLSFVTLAGVFMMVAPPLKKHNRHAGS